MRYRLSRQADRDIDEIWHYIARESIEAADRVEQALHEAMEQLAEFPGMGHPRAEVKDQNLRFWSVYSYLIAYRYSRRTLTVVRVVHGARNLRRVFSPRK